MMTLTMGLDLAVLGASAGAVLYCGQLARRLGQLRRAEGGTPKALAELSAAITASQESAERIAQAAAQATDEMRGAFTELSRQQQAAEDLCGMLDGQAGLAERRVAKAQAAADAALTSVTRRAGIELEALSRAVEIAAQANRGQANERQANERQANEARPPRAERPSPKPGGAPPDAVLPAAAKVRQRASAEPNPFLRAVG